MTTDISLPYPSLPAMGRYPPRIWLGIGHLSSQAFGSGGRYVTHSQCVPEAIYLYRRAFLAAGEQTAPYRIQQQCTHRLPGKAGLELCTTSTRSASRVGSASGLAAPAAPTSSTFCARVIKPSAPAGGISLRRQLCRSGESSAPSRASDCATLPRSRAPSCRCEIEPGITSPSGCCRTPWIQVPPFSCSPMPRESRELSAGP